MNLRQNVQRLLKEIGPGRTLPTAYDTAWLARLSELDEPIGEQALEWLRAHQLANGSWGAERPHYHHDRVICTLAALLALGKSRRANDRIRCQRARMALAINLKGLQTDQADKTIGFEMLLPTLMAEAQSLGLIEPGHEVERLNRQRVPGGKIDRTLSVAFAAEMAGPAGLHLLDVENLQEANGSVGHSPSATAYFALHARRQDPAALGYLRQVVVNGGAPALAPFDVFERAWTLWNLSLVAPLDGESLALLQPHLDFLQAAWQPGRGVGLAAGYTPKDGSNTALAHEALTRFGRPASLDDVLSYKEETHFRCYALETHPSVSANVHALEALRRTGLAAEHPSVAGVIQFLFNAQQSGLLWFDKWHVSPYYATAHAIVASAGYVDWLIENAVHWILATQHSNGSWGYYVPTAEETAYCLQALVAWKQSGHPVPNDALKRGAAWLTDHAEPPYLPLWIGKCLYCPERVVRSTTLSALMLAAQER